MRVSFIIIFSFVCHTFLSAQNFSIQHSSTIEVKNKDAYPIRLIASDEENIVVSKGTTSLLSKEIEIFSKSLKSSQIIKLKTKEDERADNAIWTGKNLIVLWEKKIKNDKSFSFQLISKNGRSSNKSNIGNIEDGFSNNLKDHHVEVIKSPDNEYFAFIIKDIITKKVTSYTEVIAIFNKDGKLIEKQKNKYSDFSTFDGFHFISSDSQYIKISKNKNQLQIHQKNFIEKNQSKFSIPLEFPKNIITDSYTIEYNPQLSIFSFFSLTKNDANILGYNGEIFIQFDIKEQQQKSLWIQDYSSEFLDEFRKSDSISGGYILNKDFSLNTQFKIRKSLINQDGSYFLIREYYPTISPLKKDEQYATKSQELIDINGQINAPYNMLDLIVSKISNQGAIEWVKRLPKSQYGLGFQYGSFDAFINSKHELVILYNIELNAKSFIKKIENNYINNYNISPLAKTITSDGEVSTYHLSKWIGNDLTLFPISSINIAPSQENLFTISQEKSKSKPTRWKLTKIGFQ
ncbi:MAG: hypothetical protein M9958_12990 [Chitinophagales bacterium]|nr:hypothetical protein [Chitinophagales bacterium]